MSVIIFSLTDAQAAYLRSAKSGGDMYRFDYRTFQKARERGLVTEGSSWREPKLTPLGSAALKVCELLKPEKTKK